MYEETKVRFNWKSLIIKLLIIAIILVLIIILFPLIVNKKDSSEIFKENATTLKEVGTKYFAKDNLPKEVGDSIKVSLKDLIKEDKINTLKVGKTTCDEENSYVKVVKKSKGYELESTLICGEERNTSYTYLGCIDSCDNTTTTTTTTTKKITTTRNSTTKKITTTTTTTKHVKYAVIFNRNMGSDVTTVYVNKGGYVSRPADPVREGYKFAGWYYNNTLYDFNNSVNKNIVLIAKWERI